MPKAKDERAEKAFELYKQGRPLTEIAKELGVADGTVRSWKNRYGWDGKGNATLQKKRKKECNVAKKEKNVKKAVSDEMIEVTQNTDLTDKQQLFCLYFVKYRNKVKAYQKAYGCSYECACGNASNLWKKIEVQKEIQRLLNELHTDIRVDIKDLFQWYLDIARADINDFVDIQGSLVQVRNEIDGTLVSEISETSSGIKVKLNDRMKALEWLDEHIGLADEKMRAEIAVLKAQIDTRDEEQAGDSAIDRFLQAIRPKPEELTNLFEEENNGGEEKAKDSPV